MSASPLRRLPPSAATAPLVVSGPPPATGESARQASSHAPVAPGQAPTLLLVEDDPGIRALYSNFLRHAGYRVLDAGDGSEALDLLDLHARVDLLITDVVMPHTDGPTLVGLVRARQPEVRVLYVSGYELETAPASAAMAGTTHACKPLTRSALLGHVTALLGPAAVPPVP